MSDTLHAVTTAREAIASLDAAALSGLDDETFEALVGAVGRLRAAVDGLWLRAAAGAEQRGLHRRHHCRDTGTWLARVAGERPGVARRDVELAGVLAAAPVVATAVAEQGLSKAKTVELARAAPLPDEIVHGLAADAVELSVEQVAAAVRRARLDHDVTEPVVEPCCEVIRSHDRVRVNATLDLVDGELVEIALDAYADTAQLPKDQPYAQRRAAALAGLARYYLDHAPEVAMTRIGRPHVLVLVDVATLQARSGGTATLASGAVITGDQARRLAQDANINRIITKGRSQVLDVGRTTRTVPPHLAKAVIARDRHCRYRHCTAPPWACEIHHHRPWAQGGPTSLDNLGLLCWHHHHLTHDGDDDHELTDTTDSRWQLRTREPAA